MAIKGKPKIPAGMRFDVPWPENLQSGKVNLLWRSENGQIVEVGFLADTLDGAVEEWYEVPEGQTPEQAVIDLVHPRVSELAILVTKAPIAAPEPGKDYIAPSVNPVEVSEKAVLA